MINRFSQADRAVTSYRYPKYCARQAKYEMRNIYLWRVDSLLTWVPMHPLIIIESCIGPLDSSGH
jgi:hypothetical protein